MDNPKYHYVPCPHCKAYFSYKKLSNHYKYCTKEDQGSARCLLRTSRSLKFEIHPCAKEELKIKIFPLMKQDEIFCY